MRYRREIGFRLHPIWVIIGVNFLLFIVTIAWGDAFMTIQGKTTIVYKSHYYLGLMPAIFIERPWTIVTNMFVHAGPENFWHILGNMITLYFLGSFFARLVGQGRFLAVYFVGGILGNIFYLLLGDFFSIAVGASGAIYAVAGALVMLTPNLRVMLYFIVPMPLWVVVIVFMIIWSFVPGVAWQAHLGGLMAGLVAGYFFRKGRRYYHFR